MNSFGSVPLGTSISTVPLAARERASVYPVALTTHRPLRAPTSADDAFERREHAVIIGVDSPMMGLSGDGS